MIVPAKMGVSWVCMGVVSALALLTETMPVRAAPESLEMTKTIALPEVRGRIDHLDIDLVGERLFVAALGNDTVEIIDLKAGRAAGRLEHLREPQGIAYVAKVARLFVANGAGGVSVFAGKPPQASGAVLSLEDADNAHLDDARAQLYVGYGRALAEIDTASNTVTASVPLAGHPEGFQLDTRSPRIFVNVPSAGHIAVVDRDKHEQLTTWRLVDAKANFPMAIDAAHRRLFVGTRQPPRLLAYDTETGSVVASLPIGRDIDDLFYDAKRQQIYAICGEGIVNVIKQRDVNQYASIGEVKTVAGARTGLFVAERNALYVAIPARGASTAEVRVYTVR